MRLPAEFFQFIETGSTLADVSECRIPDVTFTYRTCTECEPDLVFAALQYGSQEVRMARPFMGRWESPLVGRQRWPGCEYGCE
jgi:hypothetical protein